jgi:hypothetical protein
MCASRQCRSNWSAIRSLLAISAHYIHTETWLRTLASGCLTLTTRLASGWQVVPANRSRTADRRPALTTRPGRRLRPNSPRRSSTGAVCAGGQGRDRTADLPLFRRSLIPTELPGQRERNQGVPGTRPPSMTTATQTGLEPATFAVTGRRANQLRHWALPSHFASPFQRNGANSIRHSHPASQPGFRAIDQPVHPFSRWCPWWPRCPHRTRQGR